MAAMPRVPLDTCIPPDTWTGDNPRRTTTPGTQWVCTHGYAYYATWQATVAGNKLAPVWVCAGPAGTATLPAQIAAVAASVAVLQDVVTAQAVRIATLEARGQFVKTVHVARADSVTVALGGTVDVTFTWPTPFTDATYDYEAPVPPTLVGKVAVTQKSKTAAAVVLTLKSNTLAVAAFTWQATAWKVG